MELGTLVLEYGVESVLIALITILLVGVVKIAFKNQLDKVAKENRKVIYEVASIVIVVLLTVGWVAISGGGAFELYMTKILASYGGMKVMYPLYENFKIRDLFQLIVKIIKEKLITMKDGKIVIGVNDDNKEE
jgi:hypothetical protein